MEIVPQEPTTAAFTRYGDIPLDLSTGVPQINIPLYSLKAGQIEIPVSISYHASGIKVQDVASEIGLGWVMSTGGVVTRTVLGAKDEMIYDRGVHMPYYKDSARIMQDIELASRNGTYKEHSIFMYNEIEWRGGADDVYSDRYYYHLATGEDGIFRRDFRDSTMKMVPYSPTKPIIDKKTNDIEIITADGNHYYFKWNYRDLWYLTKIVSNNKIDSISFYSHIETIVSLSRSEVGYAKGTKAEVNITDPAFCSKDYLYIIPNTAITINRTNDPANGGEGVVLYDSIVSTMTSVKFIYTTDRQDLSYESIRPKSRLSKIEIRDRYSNEKIREASLYHSYFGTNIYDRRLRLDSLVIGTTETERYAFKYNQHELPMYPGAQFWQTGKFNYSEDYWGYYNGHRSENNLPYPFFPEGANKITDPIFLPACTLQEIKYPTGGKSVFEFEPNKVWPLETITTPEGYIGGLRIKQISNYADEFSSPLIKRYEYNIPVHNPTYDPWDLFTYMESVKNSLFLSIGCRFIQESNPGVSLLTPLRPLLGFPGKPVIYSLVTEYLGSPSENYGKTEYSYRLPTLEPEIFFAGVDYDYKYLHPYQFDRGTYRPNLIKRSEYKYENQTYKVVKETLTEYSLIRQEKFPTGINLASTLNFFNFNDPSDNTGAFNIFLDLSTSEYLGSILCSNTWAYTDFAAPSKTIIRDYTNDDNYITTTNTYNYNELLQLTSQTTTTSNGPTLKTVFRYVNESKLTEPYKTMFARNSLSPVIEQSSYKGDEMLTAIRNNYKSWTSSLIAPSSIESKSGTTDYETRISYLGYDKQGNILELTQETGITKTYLWGYNKSYPIAEMISAEFASDFAYSSFEDGQVQDTHRWTINGSYQEKLDPTSPTGNRCLNLSIGSLYKGGLNPKNTYIVSFWYKDSPPIIDSGVQSDRIYSAPVNGWIHTSFKLTGTGAIRISGAGFIDEACIYPIGSSISTYTYAPLIGMTTKTDTNGLIIHFEYDSLNRLKRTFDQNGNTIKRYEYHYKK